MTAVDWRAADLASALAVKEPRPGLAGFRDVALIPVMSDYALRNPVEDLVPVCPNCHAMLHSSSSKTLTVAELKDRIRQAPEAISRKHESG